MNKFLAPAIALIFYVCKMTVGEVSGGSFNPARAIAPAIIAGKFGED